MFRKLIAALLLITIPMTLFAQGRLEDPFESEDNLARFDFDQELTPEEKEFYDRFDFSLITIESGDEIFSYYGHTGLLVEQNGYGYMYDWGIFNPQDDHFVLNFLDGELFYSGMAFSYEARLNQSQKEARTVTKVPLNLNASQKKGILQFLDFADLPENQRYLYHFFEDNCSTRVRDILNAATGGEMKRHYDSIDADTTYRESSMAYQMRNFPMMWILNFLQGSSIDKPITQWDMMYLPYELEKAVMEFDDLGSERTFETGPYTSRPRPRDAGMLPVIYSALAGAVLGLLMVCLSKTDRKILFRAINIILYLFLAVLSTVLFKMTFFSHLDTTFHNSNIILCFPIMMLFFAFTIRYDRIIAHSRFYLVFMMLMLIIKITFISGYSNSNWMVYAFIIPYLLMVSLFSRKADKVCEEE